MSELSSGTTITFKGGGSCTVERELGRGAQGIVYRVSCNGKPYALKWYTQKYGDQFYDNLAGNVERGAPSDTFLWPLRITERQHDSFGYLMELRPDRYREVGQFLLAKARFASMEKAIRACLIICTAFQRLHAVGLSYGDLNDGNFFIDPDTGDVLICDNDNVVPNGEDVSGIIGKPGYMAPEIIEQKGMPDRYSDYFSQAVILFLLLLGNRPFEGKWAASCPCLTEEMERKLNGFEAVFVCDPDNDKNRPVKGLHNNVIRRWPHMPQLLRQNFERAFGHGCITNPQSRPMDQHWQKVLLQVQALYAPCPFCGKSTFLHIEHPATQCLDCDAQITRPACLKVGSYLVPLVPGQIIGEALFNLDKPFGGQVGHVDRWPQDPKLFGIVNTSSGQWIVTTPSGNDKVLKQGEIMPARVGMKIRFPDATRGEII